MSRENKLSIVIAFGLLIFVGMLVADYISIASNREVGDLGSNAATPPLAGRTQLEDGPPPPNPILETSRQANNIVIVKNTNTEQIHVARRSDTLRSICRDFYGDSGIANAVAQWNHISNPDEIELDQRITLPSRASLFGNFAIEQSIGILPNEPKTGQTQKIGAYTVKEGDTLSEIAQKIMGTTKLTPLLIEFNRDVMPDPDRIHPGMILKYPTTTP